MKKGKFGIYLWFYAAMAFILAFLGQILLGGLLLGFVIVAEKDEWTTKQVMQAFFLSLCSSVLKGILDIVGVLRGIPLIGAPIGAVLSFAGSMISLLVLVFVIIALIKVTKGQNADVPVLSQFADRAFDFVGNWTASPQQPPVYPQNPGAQQNPPQNPRP